MKGGGGRERGWGPDWGIRRSWGPQAPHGGSETALARVVGGDGTGPAGGGLALSVTALSGPVLPGCRCPWMRPPRPVSVPAVRALPGRRPPLSPCAAVSGRLSSARCPRPAPPHPGRRQRRPSGREEDVGRGTASPGLKPGAYRAARSGTLRLVGSRGISVGLFLRLEERGHLRERGSSGPVGGRS